MTLEQLQGRWLDDVGLLIEVRVILFHILAAVLGCVALLQSVHILALELVVGMSSCSLAVAHGIALSRVWCRWSGTLQALVMVRPTRLATTKKASSHSVAPSR